MFENVDLLRFFSVEAKGGDVAPGAVEEAEKSLRHKIPEAYLRLLAVKNGDEEWRKFDGRFLRMTGFLSLDDLVAQRPDFEEWGFPDVGLYFSWTESAGHEALVLNYREIKKTGEPSVWLLDQELETGSLIADTLEEFVEKIVSLQGYPDEESPDHSSEYGDDEDTAEGDKKEYDGWTWVT